MNSSTNGGQTASVWNVPNQLSALRLVLALAVFCLMVYGSQAAYWVALVLFLVAAGTDWLDGYIARKYDMVTTLGRILDPFVDKVIICGTFIFLLSVPRMTARWYSLQAWMVVVIVGRELLVTALRSFLEQRGADFSARWSGKWKMVFQCAAAALGLLYVALGRYPPGQPALVWWPMVATLWIAVLLTVWSGAVYVGAAARLTRASEAASGNKDQPEPATPAGDS